MKKIALLLILFNCSSISFSQDKATSEDLRYFIVLYTTGENWDHNKETHEQLYFSNHSSHLAELRKSKKIQIGGRYSDTGMIILKAIDEKDANALITKDIAIQNKLFNAEIFPLNAFYKGCVD